MATELVCEIHPRLDAVSAEEWRRLFPDLPDSLEMIRLLQRCGIEGFVFHSIVVRWRDRPLLLLPLFETDYHLSGLVDVRAKRAVDLVMRGFPCLRSVRLLGVGFVESEWGQVGVDRQVSRPMLGMAWDLALRALDALGHGLGADVTAFINFTTQSGRMLPMAQLERFSQMAGLPFAQLSVRYTQPAQYIASLSANMRSSLRRKLRKAQGVRVVRTREPGPWLDAIYEFYLETFRRSDITFSQQPREFFQSVCQWLEDAVYALYFVGDRLAGFRLQIVRPDCLLDKYFGMDRVLGREHNLYFVSWFKDVEYCIAQGIRFYHAGLTEEETKARLGAQLIPSRILFRHRQSVVHRILTMLARYFAYRPAMALPAVHLGSDWEQPPVGFSASEAPVPVSAAIRMAEARPEPTMGVREN